MGLSLGRMETIVSTGGAAGGEKARRMDHGVHPRLARVRFLANLLDSCIVLPGGMRIGLDPLMGLVPWVGDLAGTLLSLYLVFEAAMLGVPKRVLGRMIGNIGVETLAGLVPVLGDLFDAVWKSNVRNLALIEAHHRPGAKPRSAKRLLLALGLVALLFAAGMAALLWMAARWIISWFA